MPVELPSGSHVDTPAWQSFELRMRARAAERRKARRQRRVRRLTYTLAALLALALGVLAALAWRQIGTRVVVSAQRALAPRPIVVEWPPAPAPPAGLTFASIAALPIPADWVALAGAETETGRAATEPASEAEAEPPLAPAPTVARAPEIREPLRSAAPAERPTATGGRRAQPIEPPNASFPASTTRASASTTGAAAFTAAAPTSRAATPTSGAAGPQREREQPPAAPARSASETLARNQPIEPAAAASLSGSAGAAGLPRESEPSPAPAPSLAALGRHQPSEPAVVPDRSAAPLATKPAAAAAVAAGTVTPRVDPRDSVRNVLERYRSAYQRLDASAARAVWPGVDAGALARAFSALSRQELWFEGCTIDVSGATADATCKGQSRIVPKIGGGSETVRRTWQFTLRQSGTNWVIDRATVK